MKPRIRITKDEDGYRYEHFESTYIMYWLNNLTVIDNNIWLNRFYQNIQKYYANDRPTTEDR